MSGLIPLPCDSIFFSKDKWLSTPFIEDPTFSPMCTFCIFVRKKPQKMAVVVWSYVQVLYSILMNHLLTCLFLYQYQVVYITVLPENNSESIMMISPVLYLLLRIALVFSRFSCFQVNFEITVLFCWRMAFLKNWIYTLFLTWQSFHSINYISTQAWCFFSFLVSSSISFFRVWKFS